MELYLIATFALPSSL